MTQDGTGAHDGPSPDDGVDWRAAYLALENQVEQIMRGTAHALGRRAGELAAARSVVVHEVQVTVRGSALQAVIVADGADLEYAFAVRCDGVLVLETTFDRPNTVTLDASAEGSYLVEGTARSRALPALTATAVCGPVE